MKNFRQEIKGPGRGCSKTIPEPVANLWSIGPSPFSRSVFRTGLFLPKDNLDVQGRQDSEESFKTGSVWTFLEN